MKAADGSYMPTTGLVILVASTNGVFGGPTPTSFVSSNNAVLAKWDLSNSGSPGLFSDSMGEISLSSLPAGFGSGNQLMLYWFPTLTISATAPGAGTSYGFYRDATAAYGNYGGGLDYTSDPWFIPASSGNASMAFYTTDDPYTPGGHTPAAAGLASYTVPSSFSPPTVNPATYTRTSGLGYKFSIANLLTNVVDPYPSNVVVFTSVSSTSTNGITLSTNNNEILYPSNAPNVTDMFTYTVTDTNTALSATGNVYIVIGSVTGTNSIVSLKVGVPGAGTNSLQFVGIPNYTYVTQYATNVAGPWLPFSTNTASTNGLWTAVDVNATNVARFYRAAY